MTSFFNDSCGLHVVFHDGNSVISDPHSCNEVCADLQATIPIILF